VALCRYLVSCRNSVLPTDPRRRSSSHHARRSSAAVQLATVAPPPLVSRRQSPSPGDSPLQARPVRPSSRAPGNRGLTRRRSVSPAGQAAPRPSPHDPCKSTDVGLRVFYLDYRESTLAVMSHS